METKRLNYIKANIADIINSRFVRKDGLEPSYVLSDIGMKISKAKIVGSVIDKFMSEDGNYSTLTINDDTGSIRCKLFKENAGIVDNINIGDFVVVVGKVREYADEIYIVPNFVRKLENKNFFILHKLEALKDLIEQKKLFEIVYSQKENFSDLEELKNFAIREYMLEPERIESIMEAISLREDKIERDYKSLIIEKIRELDEGRGVELSKLTQELNVPVEILSDTINELLSDGICFEPLPGLIKLV
ncbi:MAG: OB-fold nucleic acid binding domain-containing protein [Candidatus Aenigmatarchaeota archaeon]